MKLRAVQPRLGELLGVSGAVVETHAARLRPAGLLSCGPRGAGAPEATPRDLASLTLSVLGGQPTRAVDVVVDVGGLASNEWAPELAHELGLSSKHTFLDAISAVIANINDVERITQNSIWLKPEEHMEVKYAIDFWFIVPNFIGVVRASKMFFDVVDDYGHYWAEDVAKRQTALMVYGTFDGAMSEILNPLQISPTGEKPVIRLVASAPFELIKCISRLLSE